jgi:uncharacterized repeat protein (TIGR01451 family)
MRSAVLRTIILMTTAVGAHASFATTIIDSFSTNQSALTLTFPPAGTSASSSVSGADILGGERDVQVNLTGGVIAGNTMSGVVSSGFFSYSQDATIAGSAVVQWDGNDGSATLNPNGLGGVDLTSGGSQDVVRLGFFFDDLPANVSVSVYSDATHASTATLTLPGLIFSSTNTDIPMSAFTASLGSGADFTHVGAITLTMGSATTAPDIVLDSLAVVPSIVASQTVAFVTDVNGNGVANAGDVLRYTLVVASASGTGETNVVALPQLDPNTTLLAGSVTTTQGTIVSGNSGTDTSANIAIGTLTNPVTITFDVTVNAPLPGSATQISSQSQITSSTLTNVLSDDPSAPGDSDPTVINASSMPVILQDFRVD